MQEAKMVGIGTALRNAIIFEAIYTSDPAMREGLFQLDEQEPSDDQTGISLNASENNSFTSSSIFINAGKDEPERSIFLNDSLFGSTSIGFTGSSMLNVPFMSSVDDDTGYFGGGLRGFSLFAEEEPFSSLLSSFSQETSFTFLTTSAYTNIFDDTDSIFNFHI